MSERDELASVIVEAYGEDPRSECPCEQDYDVADAILAAGYRRPRTVTTVEELDALPISAVVRGKWLAEKWADEEGELWYVAGKGMRWDTEQLVQRGGLPAEVLQEER